MGQAVCKRLIKSEKEVACHYRINLKTKNHAY